MPSYEAGCGVCGAVTDYVRPVAQCQDTPSCGICGGKTWKLIRTAPLGFVKGNFDAFKSPVDGSIIRGTRDLREHNLRNNVVNVHEGYDEVKVISGDFNRAEAKPDKKDIASDIREAVHKVQSGYKPVIEAYEDD